jgi:hypothetical protein
VIKAKAKAKAKKVVAEVAEGAEVVEGAEVAERAERAEVAQGRDLESAVAMPVARSAKVLVVAAAAAKTPKIRKRSHAVAQKMIPGARNHIPPPVQGVELACLCFEPQCATP